MSTAHAHELGNLLAILRLALDELTTDDPAKHAAHERAARALDRLTKIRDELTAPACP